MGLLPISVILVATALLLKTSWFPVFPGLGFWWYVAITFVLVMASTFSATLYLHRSLAHKSVTFVVWFEHVLRICIWLTTGMRRREWVAVHRKHHPFADRKEDPHTPAFQGVWHVVRYGLQLYRKEAANPNTIATYAHDIPFDWIDRRLYHPFSNVGIFGILPALYLLFFGSLPGFVIWIVQMFWFPYVVVGFVNAFSHSLGKKGFGFLSYRNHNTPDLSVNLWFWLFSFLTCGETNHNCHHAHPASAQIKCRRSEIDPGWWAIVLLKYLRIARDIKIAKCEYSE